MKLFKVFSGTTGLNTKIDPVRLKYEPETGVQELAVAYNVDIDDTGRLSRRKGFTERVAINSHSIFCEGGMCLFVTGDALSILYVDYTYAALRNVTVGARMRYAQVNDYIYYCNGRETGIVVTPPLSVGWLKEDYVGPETERDYVDPPVGTDIALYRGRMYVVQGNVVWASEPFGFNLFDLTRSYIAVDSEIRMIRAVKDGIYVSSQTKTYFFKGTEPSEFEMITVANYPVAQYSDFPFHGRMVFPMSGTPFIDWKSNELSAMWMSERGVCYAGHDGDLRNLTQDKVDLAAAISGSSLIYEGKFIGLLNP